MAESSLSLSFEDLRDSVYEYVYGGDGNHSAESDSNRKNLVDRMIYSGLRQFYKPPPVGGRIHDWSFLMPITTLSINAPYTTGTIAYDHTGGSSERLVTLSGGTWPTWAESGMIEISGSDYPVESRLSDTLFTLDSSDNPGSDVAASTSYNLHQDDYDLPDDFGRVLGPFTFAQADNAWYTCQVVGESRIRELRQRDRYKNYSGGDPQFAAIRAKAFTASQGTRQEVLFWPQITSSATVTYKYRVRPNKPSSPGHDDMTGDYLYGGSDHSETILYSCLSEAERRVDDEKGPMWERFQECLASSVMFDSRDNRSEHLGYNGDDSDGIPIFNRNRQFLYSGQVTYKDE
jgi:hypothetical protein